MIKQVLNRLNSYSETATLRTENKIWKLWRIMSLKRLDSQIAKGRDHLSSSSITKYK